MTSTAAFNIIQAMLPVFRIDEEVKLRIGPPSVFPDGLVADALGFDPEDEVLLADRAVGVAMVDVKADVVRVNREIVDKPEVKLEDGA